MAYQDEQSQKYSIPTFVGYRQSIDESQMNPGETNNAQNYIVNEGVLEVTKGYTKYANQTVPGGIQSLFPYYTHDSSGNLTKKLLAASPTAIYVWTGSAWSSLKTGLTGGRFDYVNYYKGLSDLTIITNGKDNIMQYNGVSISDLGGDPPKGTSIGLHYHRLWVGGIPGEPNVVAYSGQMDPENWTIATNDGGRVSISAWDGGKVEAISTIFDDVVIFRTYDIWRIMGTYPGEYENIRLYSAVGSIARSTVVDAGNMAFFLDKSGIYVYDGMQTSPISGDVKDIIQGMNLSYASEATAVFFDNKYILAIPEGSSTKNNCIIEFDMNKKNFIVKRGFQVNDFLEYDDKLLFSNDTGYVYEYESGDDFDGTPIVAYWDTPSTSLNSLDSTKRSTYLYTDIDFITGGVKVVGYFDSKSVEAVITSKPRKGTRFKGKGRKFKLRFENVAGSRFVLKTPELLLDVDID